MAVQLAAEPTFSLLTRALSAQYVGCPRLRMDAPGALIWMIEIFLRLIPSQCCLHPSVGEGHCAHRVLQLVV
ncbi:hypothetical protein chiPu_0016845 [Chiloscyllium punctatum]|uniref:Uncharacterized protein n=1 Tax=Chiloscyllium punctatum TaxID=137246 RepID=A0A401T6N7_CHIPU|nr:hypothetical protein [Chiloscyllium punctatum]